MPGLILKGLDTLICFTQTAGTPSFVLDDAAGNQYTPPSATTDPRTLLPVRVMGKDLPNKYIPADSLVGVNVYMNLYADYDKRRCAFYVTGVDYTGPIYQYNLIFAVKYKTAFLNTVQMKRVVSLDQSVPPGTGFTHFSNYVKPLQPGYLPDGSFMRDVAWADGKLFIYGSSYDWTTSFVPGNLSDPLNGSYYRAMLNSGTVVDLSMPVSGSPQSETVTIHH